MFRVTGAVRCTVVGCAAAAVRNPPPGLPPNPPPGAPPPNARAPPGVADPVV